LARAEFTALIDDRHYFPPYDCAVIVRTDALKRFAGLERALQTLNGRISEREMRRLNAAVDVEHRPAADVAREFLAHR
jgi:glycine betaine/choline ABC-type transport system substrate-binding protein